MLFVIFHKYFQSIQEEAPMHRYSMRFGMVLALILCVLAPRLASASFLTDIQPDANPLIASTMLINEVDVDQVGTDTGEFVELYDGGVGNTTLNGLVVVLFNGSNDLSYRAFDLDGYTTNANGYFVIGNSAVASAVLTFTNGLLQQGADAVALYEGSGTDFPNNTPLTTANLVDALVYATGQANDAELLTLLNAGQPQVNEAGAGNATRDSNQRCPNGSGGQRNTNAYQQGTPNPGALNQCTTAAATIEINSSGFTPNQVTINVDQTVRWVNADSTAHVVASDTGAFNSPSLSSGQIFTHTFTTPGVYTYHCALHPGMTGTITVVEPPTPTPSASATPRPTASPTGTPSVPAATNVLINEVDTDQTSSDTAEFIELFDGGVGNTSLTGLVLVLFNGSDDQVYRTMDLDGYTTNATGYFVVGNSLAPNVVLTFTNGLLQNGPDAVALYTGSASDFTGSTLVTTVNLLDAFVYGAGPDSDAGLLTLLNVGQPQVSEAGAGDAARDSNQRCSNGSGGTRNTAAYLQALPSSGTTNTCPNVPTPTSLPATPTPLPATTPTVTPVPTAIPNQPDNRVYLPLINR
jgi:plastocyanin